LSPEPVGEAEQCGGLVVELAQALHHVDHIDPEVSEVAAPVAAKPRLADQPA
jgi:hypothetical protein